MPSPGRAVIAAAGSGKTQLLIDESLADPAKRVLITTYTRENLREVEVRLWGASQGFEHGTAAMTWYEFLLRDGIKPYQAYKTSIGRIRSINFRTRRQHPRCAGSRRRTSNATSSTPTTTSIKTRFRILCVCSTRSPVARWWLEWLRATTRSTSTRCRILPATTWYLWSACWLRVCTCWPSVIRDRLSTRQTPARATGSTAVPRSSMDRRSRACRPPPGQHAGGVSPVQSANLRLRRCPLPGPTKDLLANTCRGSTEVSTWSIPLTSIPTARPTPPKSFNGARLRRLVPRRR